MNQLKKITEKGITAECGQEIVNRAFEYIGSESLRKRMVFPEKSMVQAEITGNYGNCRVGLQVDTKGFLNPFCTCPADMHFCKHAAAVGYTWIREPQTFFDMESLTKLIDEKSKPELAELVQQMIALHPDCLSLFGIEGFENEEEEGYI